MDRKIIAVSGKSGCGNSTVSKLLADRLGFRLVNFTFRNMALERGISFEEILELAQKDFSIDRELDARQVELAREGNCVIGSRLALWLLPEATLRLYLWAGPEARAARIQKREGGELADIMAFTKARDERDHARYLSIYDIDNDAFFGADLIINTERYEPPEIVEIAVAALEQKKS
jgi:CMP/dCMP kinase